MNEIAVRNNYNPYPSVITFNDSNPTIRSPYATLDLQFYQTKETLMDVDTYRNFLKNAESRFRASREYKAYKHYLMDMGMDRCQIMGNVTSEGAEIELHHNVLGLFDICLLIASHVVNTVGMITTFDLIELLIREHWNNRVGVTFLSKTAHQYYTNNPDQYIPPNMTFGKWWELLSLYRYGISYDLATKVVKYIQKYNNNLPVSISIPQQEQILSWGQFNDCSNFDNSDMILPYQQQTNLASCFGGY